MIPVTITPNSISLLIDGRMRTVPKGALNFEQVRDTVRALQQDPDNPALLNTLREMVHIPTYIKKATEGRVVVTDTGVTFDGEELQGVIAKRLVDMLVAGEDIRPLARFLERVSANPVMTARDEIYLFLESGNFLLFDDGCFAAFKKVREDYSSEHQNPDGTRLFNRVGTTVTMKREDVDKNRGETCSRGLHFCSWSYLGEYSAGSASRVVILKIAPEDVDAIPYDYKNSKGRTWRYHVIGETPEEECRHLFDSHRTTRHLGTYDNRDYGDENDAPDLADKVTTENGVEPEIEETTEDVSEEAVTIETTSEPVPAAETIVFKRGRKKWVGSKLLDMVERMGQRGFARKTGVPRTTLQEWLAKLRR